METDRLASMQRDWGDMLRQMSSHLEERISTNYNIALQVLDDSIRSMETRLDVATSSLSKRMDAIDQHLKNARLSSIGVFDHNTAPSRFPTAHTPSPVVVPPPPAADSASDLHQLIEIVRQQQRQLETFNQMQQQLLAENKQLRRQIAGLITRSTGEPGRPPLDDVIDVNDVDESAADVDDIQSLGDELPQALEHDVGPSLFQPS